MIPRDSEKRFSVGAVRVRVYPSLAELGEAAAEESAAIISDAIKRSGRARVILATGNSQLSLIEHLVLRKEVDWSAVEAFHMDEYVGISAEHPSSFRFWIKNRFEAKVHPKVVHYINGDAKDLEGEIASYSGLMLAAPIDLAFVGFGENGHIAFNDPHEADFNDPATLKIVTLDEPCRKQQAGEGHFANLEAVPRTAITVTCPGLFRAGAWVSCVPEARKASSVRNAFEGPISTECPASLVRRHPNASVYLDTDSAALLNTAALTN